MNANCFVQSFNGFELFRNKLWGFNPPDSPIIFTLAAFVLLHSEKRTQHIVGYALIRGVKDFNRVCGVTEGGGKMKFCVFSRVSDVLRDTKSRL